MNIHAATSEAGRRRRQIALLDPANNKLLSIRSEQFVARGR
jgi:hypothetical protein